MIVYRENTSSSMTGVGRHFICRLTALPLSGSIRIPAIDKNPEKVTFSTRRRKRKSKGRAQYSETGCRGFLHDECEKSLFRLNVETENIHIDSMTSSFVL
jgi:hypothetical protein